MTNKTNNKTSNSTNNSINEVKLSGKVYNVFSSEKIISFSLGVKVFTSTGKSYMFFIPCKTVKVLDMIPSDKEEIIITGKLSSEKYTNKEGKEITNLVLWYDDIRGV